MKPDVVVIGAGLAGLSAAVRLAESGANVLVVAAGNGSISLAPSTIDVLGYVDGARVEDPIAAVSATATPHPYSAIGTTAVTESLDWLCDAVDRGPLDGYEYWGRSATSNMLLPTALGAVKPSALAPDSIALGDLRTLQRVAVVGFTGMKDFHPALVAANLQRSGFDVQTRPITLDKPADLHLEATTVNLARFLDVPANAESLGRSLQAVVQDGEYVALPGVLGLKRPAQTREILEAAVGQPVFEIPTLPPSVPGLRLLDVLTTLLRRAGGQIAMNVRITDADIADGRLRAVEAEVSGRQRRYEAAHFVLASGGVSTGAITLGADWIARETVLGLPVSHAPAAGAPRFAADYFDPQPFAKAGVATDDELRPLDVGGARVLDNVRIVGATIAGAEPWRDKSGEGISLSSGFKAAGLIAAMANHRPGEVAA